MTLLESLLDAIVRLDGDALVMHVGEKPYVVTTSSTMSAYRGPLAWGQVELSSRVLTPDAVLSMVGQILPDEQRNALDQVGAIEHEIPSPHGVADRFTVVAARGGDDIWLELRRHPAPAGVAAGQATAAEAAGPPAPEPAPAAEKESDRSVSTAVGLQEPPEEPAPPAPAEARSPEQPPAAFETPDEDEVVFSLPGFGRDEAPPDETPLELVEAEAQHAPTDEDVDAMLAATAASLLAAGRKAGDQPSPDEPQDSPFVAESFEIVEVVHEEEHGEPEPGEDLDLTTALLGLPATGWPPAPPVEVPVEQEEPEREAAPVEAPGEQEEPEREAASTIPGETPAGEDVSLPVDEEAVAAAAAPDQVAAPDEAPPVPPAEEPSWTAEAEQEVAPEPEPFVSAPPPVEPPPIETEESPVDIPVTLPGRGATAPQPVDRQSRGPEAVRPVPPPTAPPEHPAAAVVAADDRLLQMLKVAAERGASTIYAVAQSQPMLRVDGDIAPLEQEAVLTAADIDRFAAALAPAAPVREGAEWTSEVAGVGRVRGVTFRDHRGPGLILRLTTAKSISADQLNLSPEIRELCTLADGLVLVAGTRGSGRSTLLHSFVDLINRTRSEHVVTVESEIGYVHAIDRSFVSQREARDGAAAAAAVTAAGREDADVIVVEDVQSPDVAATVLNAAASGRLVFASIVAPSSAAALENLLNLLPEADRASARGTLAGALRGVVTQALVKKASGGRVAARELLLNSPAVAAAVRSGDMKGVDAALESGSRHGMTSLTEALAALVRGGAVHAAEAWRRAPDRQAIVTALARDGVDTSFAERLA